MKKVKVYLPGSRAWFFDFVSEIPREVDVIEVNVKSATSIDERPFIEVKVRYVDKPTLEWTFNDWQLFDTSEECIDYWIKTLEAHKK